MIAGLSSKLELEERLNQSERAAAIGRLTQAVAHEIRNPLNVINLSVDQVQAKFLPDDEKRRNQFMRLLSSVKDEIVLNYGRPAHLTVETIDLRSLMGETIELVRAQAEELDVRISFEVDRTILLGWSREL
jgi:nitrogen fixation/metabolism regulation signal transduction histidine kinase